MPKEQSLKIMESFSSIKVNTPLLKWFGGLFLVLFTMPMLVFQFQLQDQMELTVPMPLFFMILGIIGGSYLWSFSATIFINADYIEARFLFGKYRMYWTDLEKFELAGGNLVLIGREKRMTLPSFEFWSGREKVQAKREVMQKLNELKGKASFSWRALFPLYKNTKVV